MVTKTEGGGDESNTIKPVHLTAETFKAKVMDYKKNPSNWVFEGDKPCIVDFYADWCKPCKMIAPIMDELAVEYAGKIDIYKVDTEKERELAMVFGINSIPYVLFVPAQGQPSAQRGALPKESYKQIIDDFLLKKNTGTSQVIK
jgi:thioredoxin